MRSARPFEDKYVPEPNSGCWIWMGYVNQDGYGYGGIEGKSWLAHRFSYVVAFGSIPDGLELDHKCRTRCCVNPAHLEPVTHAENVRRAKRATCVMGHSFEDASNVSIRTDGRRRCRACRNNRERARRKERT